MENHSRLVKPDRLTIRVLLVLVSDCQPQIKQNNAVHSRHPWILKLGIWIVITIDMKVNIVSSYFKSSADIDHHEEKNKSTSNTPPFTRMTYMTL